MSESEIMECVIVLTELNGQERRKTEAALLGVSNSAQYVRFVELLISAADKLREKLTAV